MSRRRRGRGEGSIRERADGTWEARISLGFDDNGKRKVRSVYGKTKKEVQDKLRKLQTDAAIGQLVEPSQLTVGEYLESWLRDTAKPKCSPTTFARYESLVKNQIKPHIGGVKLGRLQPLQINHMVSAIGEVFENKHPERSPAWSQKMALTLLSNALRSAVRLRLIPFNPAADIPKAKPRDKAIVFLTAEQAKKVIETSKHRRLHAVIVLALATGMRQGEIFGLRWDCIDFEKGTVTVKAALAQVKEKFVLKEPKSRQSRRTIRLPSFAIAVMKEHRERMLAEGHGSPFCFVTKNGTHISKSNFRRQTFNPALKVAGVPRVKFHATRHSHASALLNDGASIKAVSHRLGHSSVELTLRVYAHVLPDADDVLAAQVEKLLG